MRRVYFRQILEYVTMYAVIITGGKQYPVTKDQVLSVEKLPVAEGGSVEFNEVLLVNTGQEVKVGTPLLKGSRVLATVVEHGRGKKINIIKFKRRTTYLRRQGHRQSYTKVKITDIVI